jgi:RNA polymerase sigma-70 factor (ECF subfamily)
MSRMRDVVGSGGSGGVATGVGWRRPGPVGAEPANDASDDVPIGAPRLWPDPVDVSAAVLAAQSGDEDAFRVIYRAVHPGLLRYLRVLVGEEAEDVASEAWLQIARDLTSFRGDSDGFRGWAATIARHRALDHLRRQRRRPGPSVPIEQLAERPGDDDTARSAIEALDTDTALALIARLPRDQAEAVLLRVVMGLDAKAAGRVLGKRAGAVRTAAYRGLRKLATFLEHSGTTSRERPGPDSTGADGETATPT